MIGSNYKYRNFDLPSQGQLSRQKNWIISFDIDPPLTSTQQISKIDIHGVYTTRTLQQGRIIGVAGSIFHSNKIQRGLARNEIMKIFRLPTFPNRENEFHKLEFQDDDGEEWFIVAKVYTLPDFIHRFETEGEVGKPIIDFVFTLFSEDGFVYSKEEFVETGIYGLFGGLPFRAEFPAPFDDGINKIEVEYGGIQESPIRAMITGKIKNPIIYHYGTGKYFGFIDLEVLENDILVIDFENNSATLNGVNVLTKRRDGSASIYLEQGLNYLGLLGDDFDWNNQDKAQIEIKYRKIKM